MTDKAIVHVADWMASADPMAKLHQLRESGWLEEFFPELHKLYGVPQVAEHHPEIDTGIHVELVLEVATKLTTDPRARWAALVHDLGKGLTPAHVLPQHIDHEERGVDLALDVGVRFGLPEEWRWLGAMTSRHHLQAHRCLEMRPNSTIKFIRNAGFQSKPALFECFVVACQADAQGRTGRADAPYPQADYLREVFAVVREYEVQFLKLEQDRIRDVKPLLRKYAKKGVAPE